MKKVLSLIATICFAVACASLPDSDGDGIPDIIDPCPEDPDPLCGIEPEPAGPYDCANPPVLTGQFVKVHGALHDQVIVVLKEGTRNLSALQSVTSRFSGLQDVKTLSRVGQFAATADLKLVAKLLEDPAVDYVSQVGTKHTMVEWNLDRVDQRDLPLDGVYNPGASGEGVFVAIGDTGVNDHSEFGGRLLEECFTAHGSCRDGNGHGTHVAGTVGGATFGIADGVTLVNVKVLSDQGSGSDSDVIAGVDWFMDFMSRHEGQGVMNFSLGGPPMPALEAAICRAIDAGISFGVAAGNESSSAYSSSPARIVQVLTTGAMDINDKGAYFSNDGPGLDFYAPGVYVRSIGGTENGTSMAAPHVSGAAALYLERHPGSTPAEVEAGLVAAATPDKLDDISSDSPDKLLYVKEQ